MTNIIATVGPISNNREAIAALAQKTMLFRLNGSHNTLDWHADAIKLIRDVVDDAFILMDLPGIKPRTANPIPIQIAEGETVSFGTNPTNSGNDIPLTKPLPIVRQHVTAFSVNDGQFHFDLLDVTTDKITGISRSSFELQPKKGLNIPDSEYDEDLQERIYLEFLSRVAGLQIDGVGLSFVQTGRLVRHLREKYDDLVLVSKVENSLGLKNVNEIVSYSDAVMIDRGDLAAEIGLHQLYEAIESISTVTKESGKPLVMATENLESMVNRLEPSKSEVVSIGHSLSLDVDCFMLSEETATSPNFANTVAWLEKHLASTNPEKKKFSKTHIESGAFPELWNAIDTFEGFPTVLMSKSGYSLANFMSLGSDRPVVLFTSGRRITQLAKLYARRIQVIEAEIDNSDPSGALRELIAHHAAIVFEHASRVLAVYVSKYEGFSRANNLTILNKSTFIE